MTSTATRGPAHRRRLAVLTALAGLLLATAACAFGSSGPTPSWRYEVPGIWQDSSTYIHVDGQRVYLAPKLPPVRNEATLTTLAPETHILTALDLSTGRRLWARQVEIKFGSEWLATDDRIIFIPPLTTTAASGAAQSVVALDGVTGEPVWRFDAMQPDDYLLLRGSCVFVFDTAGDLLCLDTVRGSVMGTYPPVPTTELGAAGAADVQTRITDDAFYRLAPNGTLRVYDLPRPTLAYSVTLGLASTPTWLDIAADHAIVTTYADAQQAPMLHAFALPTGELRWEATGAGRLAGVAPFAGRTYALLARPDDGVAEPGLVVFDLATGARLYDVDALNDAYWVSPAGQLVVYGAAGKVSAYDLPTGILAWRADSASDGAVAIAGQGDAVTVVGSTTPFMSVGSNVDRFEVFAAADGALRWRRKERVEALLPPGTPAVLLGDAGVLELYPLP